METQNHPDCSHGGVNTVDLTVGRGLTGVGGPGRPRVSWKALDRRLGSATGPLSAGHCYQSNQEVLQLQECSWEEAVENFTQTGIQANEQKQKQNQSPSRAAPRSPAACSVLPALPCCRRPRTRPRDGAARARAPLGKACPCLRCFFFFFPFSSTMCLDLRRDVAARLTFNKNSWCLRENMPF